MEERKGERKERRNVMKHKLSANPTETEEERRARALVGGLLSIALRHSDPKSQYNASSASRSDRVAFRDLERRKSDCDAFSKLYAIHFLKNVRSLN